MNNQAKQQKEKQTQQIDSRARFRENFANLGKKKNCKQDLL